MYLIDTNIFLEIMLSQDKSTKCKKFLNENIGSINISDFSLHSIGVILFRQNDPNTFQVFIEDTLPKINIISLPKTAYSKITNIKENNNLDFNDSYQYLICKSFSYELVTMDNDFKNLEDIKVNFL